MSSSSLRDWLRPSRFDHDNAAGPWWFLRSLRTVNAAVLSLALAVVLVDNVVLPAQAIRPQFSPWRSAGHDLVVVDRTGSPAWERATRQAALVWSQPRSGLDLRMTWTTASGPCRHHTDHIEVCTSTTADLAAHAVPGLQGLADQRLQAGGRADAARVDVCSDCWIDPDRTVVVATHEIGHALGLEHSSRAGSVMFHAGGAQAPDALDYQELRARYRS